MDEIDEDYLFVDTFQIQVYEKGLHLFAEIDGIRFDSDDFETFKEFLQSIVNYVNFGKYEEKGEM